MKIEKVHVNKIKVTFTPEELIEHNLTAAAVKENAPRVQKLLLDLVRQAEAETGFCAENARLMVEALPAEGDSMVMYITKLEPEDDIKDLLNLTKKKLRLRVKSAESEARRSVLITFESFEDAIALARFAPGVTGGELYFESERYHLIIEESDVRFSDFGTANYNPNACALIQEHGKKVCDNALKTLREYF